MPKKRENNSQVKVQPQASLGSRIFAALTETEISQLVDELFAVIIDYYPGVGKWFTCN